MTLLAERGPFAPRKIIEVLDADEIGRIIVVFFVLVEELGMNAALAVTRFTTGTDLTFEEGDAMMASAVEIGLGRMTVATDFSPDGRRVGNLLVHDRWND